MPTEALHLEAAYRFNWPVWIAMAHDLHELQELLWYASQRDRIAAEHVRKK